MDKDEQIMLNFLTVKDKVLLLGGATCKKVHFLKWA